MATIRGSEHVSPSPRRWSLRLRVAVAILLAALAPLIVVGAWSQLDRNVPGRMWRETRQAAENAARAAASGPEELERAARTDKVRLRVVDARGNVAFDYDADDPHDPFGSIEERLLGASTMTLRELDETLGPLEDRSAIRGARD